MIISKETEQQVQLLLSQKKKVLAVQVVRDQTGCSLSQAKEFVDHFEHGVLIPEKFDQGSLEDMLISLLQHGKKIEAVKLYKDTTGSTLADSIKYVDQLTSSSNAGRNPEPSSQILKTQSFGSRETELQKIMAHHEPSSKWGLWKVIVICILLALLIISFLIPG